MRLRRFLKPGHYLLTLALFGTAMLSPVTADSQSPPIVGTEQGDLQGRTEQGVTSFKGIPFAAPPLDELRWQPPQPAPVWSGIRQSADYGAICPQPERAAAAGRRPRRKTHAQSEDCLTLNIWKPDGATEQSRLPVMVWIHGGAHRLGSGAFDYYDGTHFAQQGVVLVTLNYRLGLLGFFAHPALTEEAAADAPLGNYGLMDQMAALEWVQQNIARFGGDPDQVTVFGESAGGADTLYLLANSRAEGLIARAIVQSGGGMQTPGNLQVQESRGVAYAAQLGLPANVAAAALRALPAEDWIMAQGDLQGGLGFGPFVDGRFVTEAPWRAFADGRALDVPLIVGANSNEASVLKRLATNPQMLRGLAGHQYDALRKAYGDSLDETEFQRQALGDAIFVAPSRWVARQAASGQPAYLYYFTYVNSRKRTRADGANHGSEIPYIFQSWSGTVLERFMSHEDKAFSDLISACWINFAKQGVPHCPGLDWPAYRPESDIQMVFGPSPHTAVPQRAAAFDILVGEFEQRAANK